MTFIEQPQTEGETKECPSCGMDLVGRLTDYKGRFPDKLQWQSKSERKSHYDKVGNCKESKPTTTTIDTTQNPSESNPQNITTLEQKVDGLNIKVEKIFAMISEQYQDYLDRKGINS